MKLGVQSQLIEYGNITKKKELERNEGESNTLEVWSMERSMLSNQLLWNRKASIIYSVRAF